MTTGITELDEQIAFWTTKPDAMEQAVSAAFFAGMTLGIKMAREQMLAPTVVPRASRKAKIDKDVDRSPDCVLHR